MPRTGYHVRPGFGIKQGDPMHQFVQRTFPALLFVALVLSGCDDDGVSPDPETPSIGHASVMMSGDIEGSFTGFAAWESSIADEDPGGWIHSVTIGSATGETHTPILFGIVTDSPDFPTGDFSVGGGPGQELQFHDDWSWAAGFFLPTGDIAHGFSIDGALSLSMSDDGVVSGAFNSLGLAGTGPEAFTDPHLSVTIEGSFEAVGGEVP